jgi:hypothetical protein
MRPGCINSFQPSRDAVDPVTPTASLSNELFGYPQGWPRTIDDTSYPSVYTGFSPPADSIVDEQFVPTTDGGTWPL